MCLVMISSNKSLDKNIRFKQAKWEQCLYELRNKDIQNNKYFQKFIDTITKSSWVRQKDDFIINYFIYGFDIIFIPKCLGIFDVLNESLEYVIYKECLFDYLDNELNKYIKKYNL